MHKQSDADRYCVQNLQRDTLVPAFWMRQFETLPAPIELPLDRPYPSDRTFAGGTVSHRIERRWHEEL